MSVIVCFVNVVLIPPFRRAPRNDSRGLELHETAKVEELYSMAYERSKTRPQPSALHRGGFTTSADCIPRSLISSPQQFDDQSPGARSTQLRNPEATPIGGQRSTPTDIVRPVFIHSRLPRYVYCGQLGPDSRNSGQRTASINDDGLSSHEVEFRHAEQCRDLRHLLLGRQTA